MNGDKSGRIEKLALDSLPDGSYADFTNRPNKTIPKAVEGVENDDIVFLSLINNRLAKIDGLERFKKVKRLDLRANQIVQIEGLAHMSDLQELDLYENYLEEVKNLPFPKLILLDLSFNQIRSLPEDVFSTLPNLRELYLVQNKIKVIGNWFTPLKDTLETLELGANRIRTIENLHELTNLRNLWLGKNKIVEISGLDSLKNLRILSLQNNRLTSISKGLMCLEQLEELYLSENKIEKIEHLETLTNLRTLDIGMNVVRVVEGITTLTNVEELWLNNNAVEHMRDIEAIKELPKLKTLYLEHNPVASDPQYRNKVVMLAPGIQQVHVTIPIYLIYFVYLYIYIYIYIYIYLYIVSDLL